MFAENKYRNPESASAISGLLTHLNVDELREVLNDDKKFEELIKDCKGLKDIETDKEMLMASNRSLAEFNLSLEPIFSKEKHQIQELSETGDAIFRRVEEKIKELNEKSGCQNLETALALLQAAAAEMEEESEAIAEKFLEADLDVESFLEQFTTRRKIMHLRKVKTDKMSEMVNRRSSTPQYSHNINRNFNPVHAFYQPPQPPAPAHSQLPYPTGPLQMPVVMPDAFSSQSYYG
ncbi:vacuolar protein sorting 37B [Lycorma delicatula]|uniref:vacuolar protein sorting 37B n=1 Tax=Lycorma delicatula TaxID=130591 RepID=UPI003F50F064